MFKNTIKECFFFFAACVVFPITVTYLIANLLIKSDTLFSGYAQFLSLIPGKLGCYLRAGFYRFTMTHCSKDAVISFLALLSQQDTEIANGVYIGPQCNIGKCKIGQDTLLGSGVHVMSGKGQHNFSDLTKPIKDQGGVFNKIAIGSGCWIGNGALIMANIGEHCVVAAGSVVVNDVPDFAIVAGNPAKIVKTLNK